MLRRDVAVPPYRICEMRYTIIDTTLAGIIHIKDGYKTSSIQNKDRHGNISHPILDVQSLYHFEMPRVARYERQSIRERGCGYLEIGVA
jgi:hypothetical protein